MNKAVFFDRDDTLIYNIPYLGDPAKVTLLPKASDALQFLKKHGFILILISNQSGVGRGVINPSQVEKVENELDKQLGETFFAGKYHCFDHPDNPIHNCRKPSPFMLFAAQKDHHIDLSKSFMVGNKLSDVQAGSNAGCKSILFYHDQVEQESPEKKLKARDMADFVSNDLLKIAMWICDES
jgi:D-glycero-D-manno-heptose 1,7-bisphosphate phosphatase